MLLDSLQWLGHSGFRLAGRRRDGLHRPLPGAGRGPPADLILVTHGHYDHFSPQDIERLSGEHTWLVAPAAVAERAKGRVTSIAPGQALELEPFPGIEVAAVAAYNTSKRDPDGNAFHPRAAGCVGFDAERPRRAALPRRRHRRDPRDGRRGRRRRGAAAGQRHLRDDGQGGGRGGAPDPAPGGGADALGRAHRQPRRTPRPSPSWRRSRSGSWSRPPSWDSVRGSCGPRVH